VPSLTTIAPDKIALAQSAVDLVHTRAGDRDGFTPQDVQIPFSLEIRESTRPPALNLEHRHAHIATHRHRGRSTGEG
jgi:hypothetical protein